MTMNGRADIAGPPIDLGVFLEERREVVLNGQRYMAWVTTNKRYPRSIMVKLDRAARAYNRATEALRQAVADGEDPGAEYFDALENLPEVRGNYVHEAIRLLVPGVLESELDLVDTEVLYGLGQQLGYFPEDEVAEPIEGEAQPGEVVDPSTGDSPQESSSTSIPEPIPTNS